MPAGDRTGPLGQGPMTGRGAGFCAGFATPGYMNPGPGQGTGFGGGRGFGRGMAWGRGGRGGRWGGWPAFAAAPGVGYPPPVPPVQDERALLEAQMQGLQAQLDGVKQRLGQLPEQEDKGK